MKIGFLKQAQHQDQFVFDFGAILVTLGLWFWSSRLHGSTISKRLLRLLKAAKDHQKCSNIGAQKLQNGVRRLKNSVWKSIQKKAFKKSVQQWAHMLFNTSPPPEMAEGSALLEAILIRIPFIWALVANQSAAAFGPRLQFQVFPTACA